MNAGKKRPPLLYFIYFFGISALLTGFGLSEVAWEWQALPVWFWWLVPLSALVGLVCNVQGYHTTTTPARSHWQRIVLLGLGWGIPMASWNMLRDALSGNLNINDPVAVLISTVPYLVMSLVFGAIIASTLQNK